MTTTDQTDIGDRDEERKRPPEGGDAACWAGLICAECGGVIGDGSGHHPGCTSDPAAS